MFFHANFSWKINVAPTSAPVVEPQIGFLCLPVMGQAGCPQHLGLLEVHHQPGVERGQHG